jgi:general secretion pathway protein K
VQSVRGEAKTVGLQRQALAAGGLADASILLALQTMQVQKTDIGKAVQVIPVQFGGQTQQVSVLPLNGLIDLNNAPLLLLAEMYRHAGGVNPESAQTLAQATLEFRQTKGSKGSPQGFASVEDLLSVPSVTYGLYAKLKNLVTANLKEGGGRVNPLASPVEVLQVLTGGDPARAASLAARRDADANLMDTSFLKPDFIESSSSRSLSLQVEVALPGGGALHKEWQVYWGDDPRSGLPWRVLGVQQSIQPSALPSH